MAILVIYLYSSGLRVFYSASESMCCVIVLSQSLFNPAGLKFPADAFKLLYKCY